MDGPIKNNNEWRIRYNYAFYGGMDIITSITVGRLNRVGQVVVRMDLQK
jgi:hypothetical protein